MPKRPVLNFLLVTVIAFFGFYHVAWGRDEIRVVGSSTVYPFSTAVAEEFGNATSFKTPVIESTGTGGGFKLFCGGLGLSFPDIANASRRIKHSEVIKCADNAINEIIEVNFGFDGIVLATSNKGIPLNLELRHIWQALAKNIIVDGKMLENPHKRWSDIQENLPDLSIRVLGPPPTSGTRDAFMELAMEGGCQQFKYARDLKKIDKVAYKSLCHSIREDGLYIEAGENDNLIVQKIEANVDSVGIFGFSFLEQNRDKIRSIPVDGIQPSIESISIGTYPVSRSMFFYVKSQHIKLVPGVLEFVEAFLDEDASGSYGYLVDKGLIPLSDEEREETLDRVLSLEPLVLPVE